MKAPYHLSRKYVSEKKKVKKRYEEYRKTDKLPTLTDEILFFLTGLSLAADEVIDRRTSERRLAEDRSAGLKLAKYLSTHFPTEITFKDGKTKKHSVTGDLLVSTIVNGALQGINILAAMPKSIFVSYGAKMNTQQRKPLLVLIIQEYYLISILKQLKVPDHFIADFLNVSIENLRQAQTRAKKIVTHPPSKKA